ncbi:MAG: chorismate mutase [Beijerinckiaceae bacterium]
MTKPSSNLPPNPTLADIRAEIDRLDAEMHSLLMQRSEVIETLIGVKKTAASGSAFRPAREADVLRRLVERHKGLLPLDTVESIWRVIISTFTYVQAPHSVHADITGDEAAIRDSARFHFGFTVPFVTHGGASEVIAAVDSSKGDLGIFRLDQSMDAGPWWRMLEGPNTPKIIARLPFVDRPDHPAGLPVYVISKPLADAAVREVIVASISVEKWKPDAPAKLEKLGMKVVMSGGTHAALSVLTAHPESLSPEFIIATLSDMGCGTVRYHEIGGHTAPFSVKAL